MNNAEKLEAIDKVLMETRYTPLGELTKEKMHKSLREINQIVSGSYPKITKD